MIRLSLLWAVILFLAIYAWKDWYRALCGLIVLMAFIEHRDMPHTMFRVPGLNPWNLLLLVILVAWMTQRRREGLRWDMPGRLSVLLLLYLGIVLVGFVRLVTDTKGLVHEGTASLVSDYLVNTVKFAVPGLLLFDGCRSRERFLWALGALGGLYLLLGLQVIRWMPPTSALSHAFSTRAHRVLEKEIGYHRVDLAVMLAGASSAVLALRLLAQTRMHQLALAGGSLVVLLAMALTGGRGGYLAWTVAVFVLCLLRWPRYLLLAPVAVLAVALLLPGVMERALEGVAGHGGGQGVNVETLTAGRNIIWPMVLAKIGQSPIVGHGRAAMERTGLTARLEEEYQEGVRNPHNAYLELLLDNGVLGLVVIVPFYVYFLVHALSLFRDTRSPTFAVAGGVGAAFLITFLVGCITGQTFYPRESAFGMWCAMGLMLRVSVERSRVSLLQASRTEGGTATAGRVGPPARPFRPSVLARRPAVASWSAESLDGLLWNGVALAASRASATTSTWFPGPAGTGMERPPRAPSERT